MEKFYVFFEKKDSYLGLNAIADYLKLINLFYIDNISFFFSVGILKRLDFLMKHYLLNSYHGDLNNFYPEIFNLYLDKQNIFFDRCQ